MMLRKKVLSTSISSALIAFSGAALGADAPEPLAVVTVTAQSRHQQAQDVPIALQILGAEQIAKLAAPGLADMNGYIPGLLVNAEQPTQPQMTMRGIGTADFGIGTDAPVGMYIDGVYAGKTGGSLMNFNDVQRVEVLKGPQGTLFGRNSAGGAISIITREPSNQDEADLRLRVGNHATRHADALINSPLSDAVAVRLSLVHDKTDGPLRDAATGKDLQSGEDAGVRGTLRWHAPGQAKVLLSYEYEKLRHRARPAIGLVTGVPTVPPDPSTFRNPIGAPVFNDVADNAETRDFKGATLRIEKPFSWATFNATTALRKFDSRNRQDNDGTNNRQTYLDTQNAETNRSVQQELRLSGSNASVDWVAGVSFYREKATQESQVNINTDTLNGVFNNVAGFPVYSILDEAIGQAGIPVALFGNSWQESMMVSGRNKAAAVYGDVIWHLAPRLNLTTGVRVTRDDKQFTWFSPNRTAPGLDAGITTLKQLGFFDALVQMGALSPEQLMMVMGAVTQNIEFTTPGATSAPLARHSRWNDVSPRVVLDYKLHPDTMLFGSISKGYQAGGFNALSVNGAYEPEKVWNYEAGIKHTHRPIKLTVNASVFKYVFSDLQSLSLVNNGAPIPSYQVTSSDQVAHGLDLEMRWQPVRDLRLNLASAYLDQTYQHFVTRDQIDLSGQAVGAPKWSAAGGVDFTVREVAGGDVNLSLQHAYTGATRCNADALQGSCLTTPAFRVGSATQRTDLRVGFEAASRHWGIALYANNLFDKRYVTTILNTSASTLGTPFAAVNAPRKVGMELRMSM